MIGFIASLIPAVGVYYFIETVANPKLEKWVEEGAKKNGVTPSKATNTVETKKVEDIVGQALWVAVKKTNEFLKDAKEVQEKSPNDVFHPASPETCQIELVRFLDGDVWHDEESWTNMWREAGIYGADFLADNLELLEVTIKRHNPHPAMLAGARRRWIVVNRYVGVSSEAAMAIWDSVAAKVVVQEAKG
jgi:hypothetical protein